MNVCTRPQFWWRAVLVAVGVLGMLTGNHQLHFYTSQSNVLVLGYYAAVLYWMVRRGTTDPAAPRLRAAVTVWITITGLVAHFVLNHGESPLPGMLHGDPATVLAERSTFLWHYAVPAMAFLDWVAFGPRRVVPWRDALLWLCYPVAYGLTSIGRALAFPTVPDRYPYFFLDPNPYGYDWVAAQIVVLVLAFAALGAAFIALDRLLARLSPAGAPATLPSPARIPAGRKPEGDTRDAADADGTADPSGEDSRGRDDHDERDDRDESVTTP